jgi:2'-5' RNA ligase
MQVKIHILQDGRDLVAGTLTLEGGKIVAEPADMQRLRHILETPIPEYRTMQPLDARSDPEGFLRNLQFTYSGAYLRAGEVEEGGGMQLPRANIRRKSGAKGMHPCACHDHPDEAPACTACTKSMLAECGWRCDPFLAKKYAGEVSTRNIPAVYTSDAPIYDEAKYSITFPFAASLGPDRVNDFLEVEGILLDNHKAVPISLLDHGKHYPLPIGRTKSLQGEYRVWIDGPKGLAWCEVFLDDGGKEAADAFRLFRKGILSAGSIGYRVLKARRRAPDPELGLFKPGLHLLEVELLEPSLVAMPVNADAVRKGWELAQSDCFKAILEPLRSKSPTVTGGWVPPSAQVRFKSFDESKHPRGHEGNPGQFASSPGGAVVKEKPHKELKRKQPDPDELKEYTRVDPSELPWSGEDDVPSDWRHLTSDPGKLAEMTIRDIGDIRPSESSSRSAIDEMKEFISDPDNDVPPIIVERDADGFYVLDGNTRYAAAKELGYTKIPVREHVLRDAKSLAAIQVRYKDLGAATGPAMSWTDAAAGGSLVGPPGFGAPVRLSRPRKALRWRKGKSLDTTPMDEAVEAPLHRFACAYLDLPPDVAAKVLALGKMIPDADLGEDGREDKPHATARFGIEGDDADAVARVLNNVGPVLMELGSISCFLGSEAGKPYDVVKIEVYGDDIHRLHALLGSLPHTDTHPDFHPHCTIAYVKAGLGEETAARLQREWVYSGGRGVALRVRIDSLTFSDRSRVKTVLPLRSVLAGAKSLLRRQVRWKQTKSFDEGKHPRDHGKFARVRGASGAKKKTREGKSKKAAPAKAGKSAAASEPAGHPGAAHGSRVQVKPVKRRVFAGTPVETKTLISKQETGRIAEAVALAYLQTVIGAADARPMNTAQTNFPVDMIEDHAPTEVKGGLVSNTRKAQQWRLTFSKESAKEKELYESMTAEEKKAWNAEKQRRIHERKQAVIKELEEATGQKIKPRTLTVIVNPDTQTADVYLFDGLHDRIDWQSDLAAQGYHGTVRYEAAP